jgi:hypothetical protein
MTESREAVFVANLVNFVRNLPFFKSNLMADRDSGKVHEVHKFAGNGTSLSQSGQLKTL